MTERLTAEELAELKDDLECYKKAPWAREDYAAKISKLLAAAEENERLRDALESLYDAQNGPPLYGHQGEFWHQSMVKAKELLGRA